MLFKLLFVLFIISHSACWLSLVMHFFCDALFRFRFKLGHPFATHYCLYDIVSRVYLNVLEYADLILQILQPWFKLCARWYWKTRRRITSCNGTGGKLWNILNMPNAWWIHFLDCFYSRPNLKCGPKDQVALPSPLPLRHPLSVAQIRTPCL